MKRLLLVFILVTALAMACDCDDENGESEARLTEKSNVQLAVGMMLSDNDLSMVPNNDFPDTGNATNDMAAFPDSTSDDANGYKIMDPDGNEYTIVTGNDLAGYVLYSHDMTGDNDATTLVNYGPTQYTKYYYTIDANGTVHQFIDAAKTGGEL